MFRKICISSTLLACFFFFLFIPSPIMAQESISNKDPVLFQSESITGRTGRVCIVYFSGIGCSYCAKTDPVILSELPQKYPNLVVIDYEIFQKKENAPLIYQYNNEYGSGLGVPLVVFGKNKYLAGPRQILQNIESSIKDLNNNLCPLADGISVDFNNLNISSLAGSPKIVTHNSVSTETDQEETAQDIKFTLPKILSLALVDAINPCALAVLLLMLISILAYNPRDKKKVLLAGLSFVAAVFIMYLFYGLVIIRFLKLIQALGFIQSWLYKVLGSLAIILGILNIKDFIKYKPGSVGTEMPMFLRPKVKKLVSSVTSTKGAFVVGLFVTLFLLPCTIGPYVIAGGILSVFGIIKIIPWLLFYNLVFVLPMLIITGIVYLGIARVQDVSDWKDKNVRYLHLVTGIIILALGVVMLFGLV